MQMPQPEDLQNILLRMLRDDGMAPEAVVRALVSNYDISEGKARELVMRALQDFQRSGWM